MIGYILRRLVALGLTLLAAALVIFVVLEILPGDPAAVTLGLNAAPEALAALRAEMGLDKPAVLRFFIWLGGLVTGDLGQSYTYRVRVLQLITERMAVTLPLALMAIALATAIGIPLGMGVIVFTIVITGIYVRRANSEFDALTHDIVKESSK